ncbi:hypothetical protein BHE74_00039001 [Ensete ventricosum]|nr:hypothetical protein BHE74_00039001 [Ensete ventricosum]
MAAIEMRRFKSRQLARDSRSMCDSGNCLAAAEVAGRRGAAVAPDDGLLLMTAKGSRSGLGEHGRWSQEVDLCSRSLRGGGATTIGGDVLTVEIEQRGRE